MQQSSVDIYLTKAIWCDLFSHAITISIGGLESGLLYFGVGVIPNRQLKSATRSKPLTGGLGEIPKPTVKVRMREIQQSNWCTNFICIGVAICRYFHSPRKRYTKFSNGGEANVSRAIDETRN